MIEGVDYVRRLVDRTTHRALDASSRLSSSNLEELIDAIRLGAFCVDGIASSYAMQRNRKLLRCGLG